MANDRWTESTEGNLDPDLTEEAGYLDWEPRPRRRWQVVRAVLLILLLASMVAASVTVLFR